MLRQKYNSFTRYYAFCLVVCLGSVFALTSQAMAITVTGTAPLGPISNPSRPNFVRDGGTTGIVGKKVLWIFGDTLFSPPATDGASGRSNTAAFASLTNSTSVSETLDAKGAPSQFIALSSSDQAYNLSTHSGTDRYAIWPTAVIPSPDGTTASIYYLRLKVNGSGLNYSLLNTGLAHFNGGDTSAATVVDNVFAAPAPLFSTAGFTHDNFTYLYDCDNSFVGKCAVARVQTDKIASTGEYMFWDGSAWQAAVSKRQISLPRITGAGWSNKLGKYVGVFNYPFDKSIYLMTSDQPQGPWSTPQKVFTSSKYIYAVAYHPELDRNEGNSLFLTYYQQDHSAPDYGLQALLVNLPGAPASASNSPSSSNSAGSAKNNKTTAENSAKRPPASNPFIAILRIFNPFDPSDPSDIVERKDIIWVLLIPLAFFYGCFLGIRRLIKKRKLAKVIALHKAMAQHTTPGELPDEVHKKL